RVLHNALVGLYAISGVDLVHRQVDACLPPGSTWDLSAGDLVVWPDEGYKMEVTYRLSQHGPLRPTQGSAPDTPHPTMPTLMADQLFIIHHTPISWAQWVECWDSEAVTITLMPHVHLLPTPTSQAPTQSCTETR
ncbi:MAG: hypothetical protein AAFS10_24295, partial [Myxococcota bacterium]